MKKLFALFMLLIPVISYSQENVLATTSYSSDIIEVTLSVESRWDAEPGIYKNYLVIRSSESMGVNFRVDFRFDWDRQIENYWSILYAGRMQGRDHLLESMDAPIRLLDIVNYSPTQYNGKPIVVTIQ